jgi:hypothetical protein
MKTANLAALTAPLHVSVRARLFCSITIILCLVPSVAAQDLPVTSGILLHLDAGAGVTRDANNGVTRWADQGPRGLSALSTGTPPLWVNNVLNGRPVIRFPDSPNSMLLDDTVPVLSSTIWAVYHSEGAPIGGAVVSGQNFIMQRGGSDELQLTDFFHSGLRFTNPAFRIITATIPDATHLTLSSNGVQYVGGNPGFDIPVPNLSNIGHRLGGDLAELIVFDHALSLADERAVGSHLAEKYNMLYAYRLPAGAQLVAFTQFNEPPSGTASYVRQSPSGEMGFETTFSVNPGAGNPLAQVISTSSALTPIFSHSSVSARMTFENIDLSRWTDVSVEVMIQPRSTTYEPGDLVHAFITDGTQSVDLVRMIGQDGAGLDGIENSARLGYMLLKVDVPDGWRQVQLIVDTSSNSSTGAERYDFDNVQVYGVPVPVPEPSAALIALAGMATVAFVRGQSPVRLKWASAHLRIWLT